MYFIEVPMQSCFATSIELAIKVEAYEKSYEISG